MSITAVVEQAQNGAILSVQGRRYTRTFRVYQDTNYLGAYYADGASFGGTTVPSVGDAYPVDAYALVRSVNISQIVGEEQYIYECVVNYDSREERTEDNPLNEPARIRWGSQAYTEVVETDIFSDEEIASSAGERFIPGVEQDKYNLLLTFVRNEASFGAQTVDTWKGRVNSDSVSILGLPITAGQGLVHEVTGERRYRNGTTYWEVTYQIEFDPDTFAVQLLDQGTYYLDSAGDRTVFRDEEELADRPKNLDGSGGELGDASGDDPVYLTYYTRETFAFADMSLPTS